MSTTYPSDLCDAVRGRPPSGSSSPPQTTPNLYAWERLSPEQQQVALALLRHAQRQRRQARIRLIVVSLLVLALVGALVVLLLLLLGHSLALPL